MNLFSKDTVVSNAVIEYPKLVMVLERLGITLGIQDKTIADISEEYGINIDLMISFFNLQIFHLFDKNLHLEESDISLIVKYLKSSHKYYTGEFYPHINRLIDELNKKNEQVEFKMLRSFFDGYLQEVEQHFDYEDKLVFPYVTALVENDESYREIKYAVDEYKKHHDDIEDKLTDLRFLLIKFLPDNKDMSIRRQIIMSLSSLDDDLNVHARIENEIFIPLVEQIEKSKGL